METPNNLEAAFERQLDSLGKALEGTIEQWREAESVKREELSSQIKALETAIGEVKENLAEESRAHLHGIEVAKNGERDAFSLGRACRAIARQDFSNAPYEKEVFDETQKKAMAVGTDSAGGFIVPEEAILSIIEALKSRVVAYKLGARDMTVTGVPVVIPRLSTTASANWVAENAAITASDLAFEQISLSPKTAAARVALSNLLMETSNPAADRVIEEDLASQLGIAVDAASLTGDGTGGSPLGITETTGVAVVTGAALASKIDGIGKLLEFEESLQAADAYGGRLGWAIHPTILSFIREMTTNYAVASTTLSVQVIADGFASTILGHPFETSTSLTAPSAAVATNSIIFGNWEDLLIARWGGLRIMASNTSDDAFQKDQTHIRGTIRVDVGLRHTESFVNADDS